MGYRKSINKIIISTIAMSIGSSANAICKPQDFFRNSYIAFNTSNPFYTKSNMDNKSGYKSDFSNFDLAIGKKITKSYRIETTLGQRNFKYNNSIDDLHEFLPITIVDRQKISIHSFMLNHYYDFANKSSKFTPYVMAGFGISKVKSKTITREFINHVVKSDLETTQIKPSNNFTYQLGFGVDMKLTKNTSLDFGVRHVNYGKINLSDDTIGRTQIKLQSNEILMGLKYQF
ncbi:MAG: outer membrane beta-barrel protein [Alphaproteobacteria bacterium]|nr:outer membrane beta-barrel protein [Alphaproteobacteria bacterium]